MSQWPAWTYDQNCQTQKDPINVIFLVHISQIVKEFKDPPINWGDPPKYFGIIRMATDQCLCEGGIARLQNEQLVRGRLHDRFHIRLWKWDTDITVSSVHHEYGLSLGIVPPRIYHPHDPEFERGKWKVEHDFKTTRSVKHDAIYLDNARWAPFSNGWATKVA